MRLDELAKVIRSKNAGPFLITVDVFFEDRDAFDRVRSSGALDPAGVARVYGVAAGEVKGPYWHEEALGVKVTLPKRPSVNDLACTDVFGAHQHLPLAGVEIAATPSG